MEGRRNDDGILNEGGREPRQMVGAMVVVISPGG